MTVFARLLVPLVVVAGMAGAQMPREGSVPREGFDVHYRVYGAGSPVLILSGGPGFDCDYMEPVARELAKTQQTILVELRGTGRSRPPVINASTINLKDSLGDLEAIRNQMKFDRWSVLGHSAGAVLAMWYAAQHPQAIRSLVLANSGPIRAASAGAEGDNIGMRLTPAERTAAEKALKTDFGQALKIMLPGYFFDRAKAAESARELGPDKFHGVVSRLLAADMFGPGKDLPGALKDFDRPVLVIAGRQDPLDPAVQYEIHLALKNSKLHFINRCGHFSWLEQPEEFYREVRNFLSVAQAFVPVLSFGRAPN